MLFFLWFFPHRTGAAPRLCQPSPAACTRPANRTLPLAVVKIDPTVLTLHIPCAPLLCYHHNRAGKPVQAISAASTAPIVTASDVFPVLRSCRQFLFSKTSKNAQKPDICRHSDCRKTSFFQQSMFGLRQTGARKSPCTETFSLSKYKKSGTCA